MKIFQIRSLINLLVTFYIISNSIFCIAAEKYSEGDSFSLTRPGAILINREVKAMTECYVEYAKKWGSIYSKEKKFKYYQVLIWFSTGDVSNYKILINGDVNATLAFDKDYVNYYIPTKHSPRTAIIDEEHFGEGKIYMPINKPVTAYPLYDFHIVGWDTSQIWLTFINQELTEVEVYCADQLSDIFMGESVLSQYLLPHTKLIVHYYKSVIPY